MHVIHDRISYQFMGFSGQLGIIKDIIISRVVIMVDTTIKPQTNGEHLWITNNSRLITNSKFDVEEFY